MDKNRLVKLASSGITPDTAVAHRQNAFNVGFEGFLDQAGIKGEEADSVRKLAAEGLEDLAQRSATAATA